MTKLAVIPLFQSYHEEIPRSPEELGNKSSAGMNFEPPNNFLAEMNVLTATKSAMLKQWLQWYFYWYGGRMAGDEDRQRL
jgi:hypothetical protein